MQHHQITVVMQGPDILWEDSNNDDGLLSQRAHNAKTFLCRYVIVNNLPLRILIWNSSDFIMPPNLLI